MDFAHFELQLKALNYDWCVSKKMFFEMENDYNPENKLIEIKATSRIDSFEDSSGNWHHEEVFDSVLNFYDYCWNADFDNSLLQNNVLWDEDGPYDKHELPIDVKTIANLLFSYLDELVQVHTPISTKYDAIYKIIGKTEAALESNDSLENYYKILKRKLFQDFKNQILFRYESVIQHHNIVTNVIPPKPTLTIPFCESICLIPFGRNTLYKSFTAERGAEISAGEFLYDILQPNPQKNISLTGGFYIKKDIGEFYTFLMALANQIPMDFGTIETLECFTLHSKRFTHTSLKKHFSSKGIALRTVTYPPLDVLFQ